MALGPATAALREGADLVVVVGVPPCSGVLVKRGTTLNLLELLLLLLYDVERGDGR